MFYKINDTADQRTSITVTDIGDYDLKATLECGQCFRYELICDDGGYREYMTVVKDKIITVGQRTVGELIFYDSSEEDFIETIVPYFDLNTDYGMIKNDIIARTDSDWLKRAAECASGIRILKQDPWETVFSFIISQNNNIPRIKKIIRKISAEYGVNISLQNKKRAVFRKIGTKRRRKR